MRMGTCAGVLIEVTFVLNWFEMECRKLYNRVPACLPSTTCWRYANSVHEHDSVSLEDSLSFAEALLSNEASHVDGGDDIDSYFEEPSTLTGINLKIAVELYSKEAGHDLYLQLAQFIHKFIKYCTQLTTI